MSLLAGMHHRPKVPEPPTLAEMVEKAKVPLSSSPPRKSASRARQDSDRKKTATAAAQEKPSRDCRPPPAIWR